MRNAELIEELQKYPLDMPICINDCMDFTEAGESDAIVVGRSIYHCFPFTKNDVIEYLNLEMKHKEYWDKC